MADVLLEQTPDGGEITIEGGQLEMTDGLETAAFLSCFGGNERDSGLAATDAIQWWGNLGETDDTNKLRSRLQYALNTLPLTPSNLTLFEDAANADLAWLTDSIADSVSVEALMPAKNVVNIHGVIAIDGQLTPFSFPSKSSFQ